MCVIAIAETERPTREQVDAMWEANSHGAGITWRENGKVLWRKGLNLSQIQDMVRHTELPFAAHFRIPSVGPDLPILTHPFPIGHEASLELEGETDGAVLMHNGSWHTWDRFMTEIAALSHVKIPQGKWSDSRAMAFCASVLGVGWLELIPNQNRVFAFGADGLAEGFGEGWYKLASPEIWVSNKYWEHRTTSNNNWRDNRGQSTQNMVHMGPRPQVEEPKVIAAQPVGGPAPLAPFRTSENAVRSEEDVKESVQEVCQVAEPQGRGSGDSGDHQAAASSVQGTIIDPDGPLTEEEKQAIRDHVESAIDQRWWRRLNPKNYSTSGSRKLVETEDDIAHRRRRIAEAKRRGTHCQIQTREDISWLD